MPSSHQKDREPRETIARARSLLADNGILLQEVLWWRLGSSCHAVHLRNVDLPGSISNGKGVTEELALASGYAEYLERIQGFAGTTFLRSYGLMPDALVRPDEVDVELAALREAEGPLMDLLLGALGDEVDPGRRLRCVPFYDVFAGRTCLLPDLVYDACQGNGLCAGNTPEEALVQGLCEVFERHVVGGLYEGGLPPLPTIPHEAVEHLDSYALVRELADDGYRVVIKDCSLGGRFPVVGTIVMRGAENLYRAYFGAAPSLDVALQRCLTEWFQATDCELERMNRVRWEDPPSAAGEAKEVSFSHFCNQGTGRVIPALFVNGGAPRHAPAFQAEFSDNRDSLAHLVGLVRAQGLRLLVRDASFLGFPAYTVYVPGLAETELHVARASLRQGAERERLRRVLLDLEGSSTEQIAAAIATIERILDDPELYRSRAYVVRRAAGIQVDELSDFSDLLDVDYLLALLHARVGDDASAAQSLVRWLRQEGEGGAVSSREEYHWCAVARFRLRALGLPPEQVGRSLADLYSEELAAEVEADLANPEEAFRYHAVPRCGDCAACAIAGSCHYPGWKKLAAVLQRAMDAARIDQARLAPVFAGMTR
jgi:ribosomal protein S12 methylthiotransferase accessory factor